MPSIPQSLLWISLVVLWLFVLVPMLINKRETVRRTSDVALATRVLDGDTKSRLIKRTGPAAGHRHDPDWKREDEFAGDAADDYPESLDETEQFAVQQETIKEYDAAVREARMGGTRVRSVLVVAAVTEETLPEPDYLDVDVVEENSGALPAAGAGVQGSLFDPEPPAQPAATVEPDADAPIYPADEDVYDEDTYEYLDDSSGSQAEDEPSIPVAPRSASRQRRLEHSSAEAIGARKYQFRKRVLTFMAALMAVTAGLAYAVSPTLWWSCAAVAVVMVLYLGYLRRQTRIEAQVRRRRVQRLARSRPVAAEAAPPRREAAPPRRSEVDFGEFPTRLQRPGTAVLEIDDEDPVFEHLDEVAYHRRRYDLSRDLPRAAGQ